MPLRMHYKHNLSLSPPTRKALRSFRTPVANLLPLLPLPTQCSGTQMHVLQPSPVRFQKYFFLSFASLSLLSILKSTSLHTNIYKVLPRRFTLPLVRLYSVRLDSVNPHSSNIPLWHTFSREGTSIGTLSPFSNMPAGRNSLDANHLSTRVPRLALVPLFDNTPSLINISLPCLLDRHRCLILDKFFSSSI